MTEPAEAAPPEPAPPSEEALFVPKRRLWPVFAVLFAIAAVAAVLVVREMRAPVPLRVLIAIDLGGYYWEGSEAAAVLVDRLSDRLSDLGFEPVRGGDPETVRALEKAKTPLDAAGPLKAAFTVTARLDPKVEEHALPTGSASGPLLEGGFVELRVVDATLEVHHADEGRLEAKKLNGFAGAKKKPDAMKLLAQNMADQTLDAVLPTLTQHPSVASLSTTNADPKLADKVAPAKNYVEHRKKRLAEAETAYAELKKRHVEGEKGSLPVTYHGPFTAHDALGGAGAKGALVQTADVRPWFSPDTRDLGWISALETLEWRPPKGDNSVLWSGYHMLGYATPAPDGSAVVLVEDLFGWAKTITVIDARGPRRVRVDPKHRFIHPRASPGGRFAAVFDRDCYSCPTGFLVLSLDGGEELFKIDPEAGGVRGYAWLDDHRVVFLRAPEAGKPTAFFVVDVGQKPASLSILWKGAAGEAYSDPSPTRDGKRIAVKLLGEGPEQLAVLDAEKRELARYDVGGSVELPASSKGGQRIAFLLRRAGLRGSEVAVFDVASSKTTVLTNNPFEEAYPSFSDDESTVYFESRDRDPVFPRHRLVSVIASVPAPR